LILIRPIKQLKIIEKIIEKNNGKNSNALQFPNFKTLKCFWFLCYSTAYEFRNWRAFEFLLIINEIYFEIRHFKNNLESRIREKIKKKVQEFFSPTFYRILWQMLKFLRCSTIFTIFDNFKKFRNFPFFKYFLKKKLREVGASSTSHLLFENFWKKLNFIKK